MARAWVVWHAAALQRVEKLPKFQKFAGHNESPKRQKTADEIETVLRAWFGPKQ